MKKAYHLFVYILVDFITALLAWNVFYYVRKIVLEESLDYFSYKTIGNGAIIATGWIILYTALGFYLNLYHKSRIKDFLMLFLASVLGSLVLFFVLLLDDQGVNEHQDYYRLILTLLSIHFGLASLTRAISQYRLKYLIKNQKISFNTLIIGSQVRAKETYEELLTINEFWGLRFIGYMPLLDNVEDAMSPVLKKFEGLDILGKLIRRAKIENVIIAVEPTEHKKISEVLGVLEAYSTVKVSIVPDIYQVLLGVATPNHPMGVPLIEIKKHLVPLWQQILKRIFDIAFSSTVLVLGSPFLLIIALITYFSSKGPIFYSQERIGKGENPFKIYKFRSMYTDAEKMGPALASDHDPRITPWGRIMRKTRLDELPQFFNVIKGDMSIVGPRPERQYFIDKISEKAPHYKHLLKVKPGITSLGQVKYGYAENVDEMVKRLKFDILYLENMSLAMDFRIILYTIVIMIEGRGK